MSETNKETKIAYFGAGCFWGVEAAFRKMDGVTDTAVGYMGGETENPIYDEVCTDKTGHAEVVKVEYDPEKISYDNLLKVFWENHDPTQLNRQGPDVGTQYRSAIFYNNDEQKQATEKSKSELDKSGRFFGEIITEISKAGAFNKAEDYHQQYLEKRGLATCNPNFS